MVKRVRAGEGEYHQPAYHRLFAPKQPYIAPTPEEKEQVKRTIGKIKEMMSRPKPHPRAWAKRILDRRSAGENFHPYVIQCALEIVGDAPAPLSLREPGSD